VIGPAAGEVTRGKKEIKKLWKKRVEQQTRAVVSGEIVSAVTRDGQLAWVTAPITQVAEEQEPLPLRAFAVFEKSESGWTLIALHESLAFDEAGAGAPFKKVRPPVVAPPKEPEPVVAEEPKKKKKKAKPVEEDDPPKKKKKKKKTENKPKPKPDDE